MRVAEIQPSWMEGALALHVCFPSPARGGDVGKDTSGPGLCSVPECPALSSILNGTLG